MPVSERFSLSSDIKETLKTREVKWGFGAFSEVIYYRTYSREKEDGTQESWSDTVIRVVEGCFSIRKDWYKKMGLQWDEAKWQATAQKMALMVFDMKMLPPGRGLWALGTDYIYNRGSAALNNCGFVDVNGDLAKAASWAMDMLMCGVGVGFSTQNAEFTAYAPNKQASVTKYVIEDSREGWVDSVRTIINAYSQPGRPFPMFIYDQIRPEGSPIRGFGGTSSGPAPLIKLHERLERYLDAYVLGKTNRTRLIADIFNAIGACVVAGNVRRSAELALGSIYDADFLSLKDYASYPERQEIGWMSNNSVVLSHSKDFEHLPKIASHIRGNGEPGVINLINVQKYGRTGKKSPDSAVGFNPCAEIPLESYELCNLVEVFPTRCNSTEEIWEVMELATLYASTITLLPSHDADTNAVVARNHRIGVSVSGIADWIDSSNLSYVTMVLREGYEQHVEPINRALAREAGIPVSIRLTTVKPSGTISLLAGVSPGMHWPEFTHGIRRLRVAESSILAETLKAAGVPYEKDTYSDYTTCFEFPLQAGDGTTRPVEEVSIWEQASVVAMLQREWADNAVSNTLSFTKGEAGQLERVVAAFAPLVKSISFLPHETESYAQMPYEGTTHEEFARRQAAIKTIDWSYFRGDGMEDKFCTNSDCEE